MGGGSSRPRMTMDILQRDIEVTQTDWGIFLKYLINYNSDIINYLLSLADFNWDAAILGSSQFVTLQTRVNTIVNTMDYYKKNISELIPNINSLSTTLIHTLKYIYLFVYCNNRTEAAKLKLVICGDKNGGGFIGDLTMYPQTPSDKLVKIFEE